MDRMVGTEFEAGLASLKAIAEKTPRENNRVDTVKAKLIVAFFPGHVNRTSLS